MGLASIFGLLSIFFSGISSSMAADPAAIGSKLWAFISPPAAMTIALPDETILDNMAKSLAQILGSHWKQ